MAMNPEECEQMIEACEKANRLLSIGYRGFIVVVID